MSTEDGVHTHGYSTRHNVISISKQDVRSFVRSLLDAPLRIAEARLGKANGSYHRHRLVTDGPSDGSEHYVRSVRLR
jgi:hypothetical protein